MEFLYLSEEEKMFYMQEFEKFHMGQLENMYWKKKYENDFGIEARFFEGVNFKKEYEKVCEFMISLNTLIQEHSVHNNAESFFKIFDYMKEKKYLVKDISNCKFVMDIKFKIYETFRTCNDFVKNKMREYFIDIYDKEICFDKDIFIYCTKYWHNVNPSNKEIIMGDMDKYLFILNNGHHKN